MGLDCAAAVDVKSYPESTRFRDFAIPYTQMTSSNIGFIPLFVTSPNPGVDADQAQEAASIRGTALDAVEWRLKSATDVAGATAKIGYCLDGSSTVVDLTSTFALDSVNTTLTAATLAATDAESVPGTTGVVPRIPDNAQVGLIVSAACDGGAAFWLSLRLAVREHLG